MSALKIDSVSSVTPIKDIIAEKRATDPVETDVIVEKKDTVAAKGIVDHLEIDKDSVKGDITPLKENVTLNKERPQVDSEFKFYLFNHHLYLITEEEKIN